MLNHQNDKLIILKQEERAEMALLNDQRSNEKEIHALLQPAANEKELKVKCPKRLKTWKFCNLFCLCVVLYPDV